MARDGNGNYDLPEAAFVNGTTIDADAMNSDLSDIAAAITDSIANDGQTVPTANLPMGGFKHTGVGAASLRSDYARADQVIGSVLDYAADTGSATAYAIAPSPGIASYVVGQRFAFKAANANSGADPTLAINSLTAGIIYWPDGTSLVAGDIAANAIVVVEVASVTTGTPTFHVQTPLAGLVRKTTTQTLTNKTIDVSSNTLYAGMIPQGRLTLATGVPVMVSAQTGKTSILYTPYTGNLIPIYDGTGFKWTVFAELSNDTTASSSGSAGPAAVTTDSNYDLFVWSDSGTIRLTRGPAWTDATTRSAGTALTRTNGILLNNASITNGPAASRGTYVGTVRSDGSSQINWQVGGLAANGTAAILGVWNAFNRVDVRGLVGDTTDNWTYSSTTIRSANGQATMRVSFLQGLQEDYFEARYDSVTAATGGNAQVGIGYNATNAFSGKIGHWSVASGASQLYGSHRVQQLGWGFMQACEQSDGSFVHTFYGDNGGALQTGLDYQGRF